MPALETLKKITEKATGLARPPSDDLDRLVRARKPHTFRFKDDGIIPNHPRWPLVIYRGVVQSKKDFDPAAVFEDLFERNGWGDSWRDGIYDYVHYHSCIHEVLGIGRGEGKVQFGGPERTHRHGEGRRCRDTAGRHGPSMSLGQRGLPGDRRLSAERHL
jgi:hypothetical protein